MQDDSRQKQGNDKKGTCFVVMPISNSADYETGHFGRVYKHLIRPACEAANLNPLRADDVEQTNYIILDILKRIVDSDMVICDLSGRNPNVMYELGIRHAFDLPTVLIKDKKTARVFDIQGLRTTDYDERLRVDTVQHDLDKITSALKSTLSLADSDVNSLIKLLEISRAPLPEPREISGETSVLLEAIKELGQRLSSLEGRGARGGSRVLRKSVSVECPSCHEDCVARLGLNLGDSDLLTCDSCTQRFHVHRSGDGGVFTRLPGSRTASNNVIVEDQE